MSLAEKATPAMAKGAAEAMAATDAEIEMPEE